MSTEFSPENLKGRDHSEELGLDGEDTIRMPSWHST
jgi:hypothetical protein